MNRPIVRVGLAAAAVLALDLWSKAWAVRVLQHHPPISVIGDLVRFTFTRNSGVAFGLGQGTGFPFYVFSIIASLGILWLVLRGRVHGGLPLLALGLILGGAIGNLVDRVTTGEVVDFILLSWRGHDFPVFNVADSAVTIGVALFALAWGRPHEHEASHDAPAAAGAPRDAAAPASDPDERARDAASGAE